MVYNETIQVSQEKEVLFPFSDMKARQQKSVSIRLPSLRDCVYLLDATASDRDDDDGSGQNTQREGEKEGIDGRSLRSGRKIGGHTSISSRTHNGSDQQSLRRNNHVTIYRPSWLGKL